MAEIARLAAVLTLPKGTVHVISDIHGEDKKLRHVINNASGTLRPLVQKLFATRMTPGGVPGVPDADLLPGGGGRTAGAHACAIREQLRSFCTRTLRHEFELVRVLAARYSLKRAMEVFPPEYRDLHGGDAPRADDRARQGVRRGDRRRAAAARPGAAPGPRDRAGWSATWRSTS